MLIVRRRARRDFTLLLGWTALVSFAVLLSVATPQLLLDAVDKGARSAVALAGPRADLIVHSAVGKSSPFQPLVSPQGMVDLAQKLPSRLPSGLRAAYLNSVLTVLGPNAAITKVDGSQPKKSFNVQMAMLAPEQLRDLAVVSGRMPSPKSGDEVVISSAAAKLASLHVGSSLQLPRPFFRDAAVQTKAQSLTIVGIVKRTNASASIASGPWVDLPQVWLPSDTDFANGVTVLAPPSVVLNSADAFPGAFQGNIRVRLDPAKFTAQLEGTVASEITALEANDDSLAGDSGATLGLQSEFPPALTSFPPEARAAVAQMSLMIAGLLGVAATVVLLLSRLLTLRRNAEFALERARGSTLLAIGRRAGVESLVATIVGSAVALGIARLFLPDPLNEPVPFAAVVVIAVFAPVVQSMLLARAVWRGKREPANRPERLEIVKRARVRRLVIEGALLVLAIAALFSVRTRGLLETRSDGVDPLLSAAPLLLSIVITLVVLRVYPFVVRGAASVGRRSRGALGVLGAMQVQRALAVLPLLALTLAVSLAVGGGLLIDTVQTGQVDASWQRIGADVRVDAPITAADTAKVAAAPGVTQAASANLITQESIVGGTTTASVVVVAMDRHYASLVGKLPQDAGGGARTARTLQKLAVTAPAKGPLPVIVDHALYTQLVTKDLTLRYGTSTLPVRVVGFVDQGPSGYLASPFLFADLTSISERAHKPATANSLLALGPGAGAAAATLSVPKRDIHTRAGWISDRQHQSLVAGVNRIMTLSALSVALLAIIALIATVLATARTRARSLALLRTLGMRARLGWWLALAELAPVVVAALIGGILAGVGMVQFLAPSLGLGRLAGGLHDPIPSVSPVVILIVAGSAVLLLGLAMLTEVVSHRRDRLSEVLRVGDS